MTTFSNSTRHWQAIDGRHHLHPFAIHHELAETGARVITGADGVYLTDSEGKKLLDGMAGLWCVQVGYGNPEIAEAGYRALRELPYYNTFFGTTHPYVAELSEKVATLTPPGLNRIVFANSGSEANDTAIKMIRYYWNLKGRPEKKAIISRDYGYHGVTLGAASLSGLTAMHPQWDLPLPGFHHTAAPYWYDLGGDMDLDEFGIFSAGKLEEKILELGADNVAAFIGEPVQGTGGLIVPPDTYWPEIQRICRKYDVLIHADEVICGFGRTGEWFGSQTYDIAPDIMTIAKGLSSGYQPISGTILGGRMGQTIFDSDAEMIHGYTYSGHPVACAVALKNIEIMERDNLVAKTAGEIGNHFQRRLAALSDHSLVGETRGIGLLGGIELVADKAARAHFDPDWNVGVRCRNHSFDLGLVMRAVRDIMVLSPPLSIKAGEIDRLFNSVETALDRTAKDIAGLDA